MCVVTETPSSGLSAVKPSQGYTEDLAGWMGGSRPHGLFSSALTGDAGNNGSVTCGYGGQSSADRQRGWLYVSSGTKHEVVVPEVDASPLDMAGSQQVLPGRQLHTCHWPP